MAKEVEGVTVKLQKGTYSGELRGATFLNGLALNVPKVEADVLVSEFDCEIVSEQKSKTKSKAPKDKAPKKEKGE